MTLLSRTLFRSLAPALLAMSVLAPHAEAVAGEQGHTSPASRGGGFHFSHRDWELACDNTRTCRAAGYHADGNDKAVSVLLTRQAGARTPVTAQVMIGNYDDEPHLRALPDRFSLRLVIDGRPIAAVSVDKDKLVADLPADGVTALVEALAKTGAVEFVHGQLRWPLSGAGATAALLKMDEFQGRLGTPSALVRKGSRSEASLPPALPVPTLVLRPMPKAQPGDDTFTTRHAGELLKALRAVTSQEKCNDLHETNGEAPELQALRLSNTRMLVSTRCWLAAYNAGAGHWLVSHQPPFKPVLINTLANDASEFGTLSAGHKGRGLGDCWSSDEWNWDGRRFVHTQSSTSGMCRLMAAGGAWHLPTIVTRVEYPAAR